MTANQFFYITAGIAALVFTGVIILLAYEIYITLKVVRKSVKSVKGAVKEIKVVKETLKVGVISFATSILGKVLGKGGDGNGKEK
jgi:hypothetical protein